MIPRFSSLARNISTSVARNMRTSVPRRSEPGGIPGMNLPFKMDSKYKLTAYFILFFGSGLAVPFLIVRHSLTK